MKEQLIFSWETCFIIEL